MNTLSNSQFEGVGLASGWSCCLFSFSLGLFWFSHSDGYGVRYSLFHPDMMGYILVLLGLVTVPVMIYASGAAACSYQSASVRISRVVAFAVPFTLIVGWMICRFGDLLVALGVVH